MGFLEAERGFPWAELIFPLVCRSKSEDLSPTLSEMNESSFRDVDRSLRGFAVSRRRA